MGIHVSSRERAKLGRLNLPKACAVEPETQILNTIMVTHTCNNVRCNITP